MLICKAARMRTLARVLLYDVLLALVYVASDAFLAYFYFSHGHKWWGALTVGAVALPGTLGQYLVILYSGFHCPVIPRGSELHLLAAARRCDCWTVGLLEPPVRPGPVPGELPS